MVNLVGEVVIKTSDNSEHIVEKQDEIFNAFDGLKPQDVKVLIIGQDPYHEPGQAMGLSFSVPEGISSYLLLFLVEFTSL